MNGDSVARHPDHLVVNAGQPERHLHQPRPGDASGAPANGHVIGAVPVRAGALTAL